MFIFYYNNEEVSVPENTHTHIHTILQLSGLCLGQPGWAGTRRYILSSSHSLDFFWCKMTTTRQTHQQSGWTATPSRLIGAPVFAIPPFLCQMPFLAQPSKFILAWDRYQICWPAYPVAWFAQKIVQFLDHP